jgi:hypothetical protein
MEIWAIQHQQLSSGIHPNSSVTDNFGQPDCWAPISLCKLVFKLASIKNWNISCVPVIRCIDIAAGKSDQEMIVLLWKEHKTRKDFHLHFSTAILRVPTAKMCTTFQKVFYHIDRWGATYPLSQPGYMSAGSPGLVGSFHWLTPFRRQTPYFFWYCIHVCYKPRVKRRGRVNFFTSRVMLRG